LRHDRLVAQRPSIPYDHSFLATANATSARLERLVRDDHRRVLLKHRGSGLRQVRVSHLADDRVLTQLDDFFLGKACSRTRGPRVRRSASQILLEDGVIGQLLHLLGQRVPGAT
jgi:hypothetical protein